MDWYTFRGIGKIIHFLNRGAITAQHFMIILKNHPAD